MFVAQTSVKSRIIERRFNEHQTWTNYVHRYGTIILNESLLHDNAVLLHYKESIAL